MGHRAAHTHSRAQRHASNLHPAFLLAIPHFGDPFSDQDVATEPEQLLRRGSELGAPRQHGTKQALSRASAWHEAHWHGCAGMATTGELQGRLRGLRGAVRRPLPALGFSSHCWLRGALEMALVPAPSSSFLSSGRQQVFFPQAILHQVMFAGAGKMHFSYAETLSKALENHVYSLFSSSCCQQLGTHLHSKPGLRSPAPGAHPCSSLAQLPGGAPDPQPPGMLQQGCGES